MLVTRLALEDVPCAWKNPRIQPGADYLQKLGPLVRPGGIIAAHNMASPPPDPRYIEAVTNQPAYETVFLNMHDAGMGVTLKKR